MNTTKKTTEQQTIWKAVRKPWSQAGG